MELTALQANPGVLQRTAIVMHDFKRRSDLVPVNFICCLNMASKTDVDMRMYVNSQAGVLSAEDMKGTSCVFMCACS